MSTGYKIEDQGGLRYVTLQVVGWVDIFTPFGQGLLKTPEDYLYSSARDLAGKPCLLDVVPVYMPTEKLPLMRTVR